MSTLDDLVDIVKAREPLGEGGNPSALVRHMTTGRSPMYENRHERLGIDFSVCRLAFEDLQTMDPRVVTIAPGCCNELHKHAHESLFVVLEGEAEVRIGSAWHPLQQGQVAFVPRWIFHQTRNASSLEPLVLLAVTDFGFTSAVLGDYDGRTRLLGGGDQADS